MTSPHFLWRRSTQMEQLQAPSGATFMGGTNSVHVVPSVTIITEQQLVIILAGAVHGAGLALDALPGVLHRADHHVGGELQACRVT